MGYWSEMCRQARYNQVPQKPPSSDVAFPLILEDAPVKRFAYAEASEITQDIHIGLDGLDKPLRDSLKLNRPKFYGRL